jgi:hypothetical protein
VPAGSTAWFNQPSAGSTSINLKTAVTQLPRSEFVAPKAAAVV